MTEADNTTAMLKQLAAHRATLATLLHQLAIHTYAYAPPALITGIAEARAEIARLKAQLRAAEVAVDDVPGDEPTAGEEAAAPMLPIRQHTQTIEGNVQVEVAVSGDNYGVINVNQLPPQSAFWRPEDRAALLVNVRRIWIDGVLKQSLWNDALIELRLEEQPDAVQIPFGLDLKTRNGVNSPLPKEKTLLDIYDEYQGLLILGEAGSGKTTQLLELARVLLERAKNTDYPIPVVFNLASWGTNPQPIDTWMVLQLYREYGVPQKIGQAMVDAGDLLPLFDALDEVVEHRRINCVEAINVYRKDHPKAWRNPFVICCRSDEYNTLLVKVNLQAAVTVQPITRSDVDVYFRNGGSKLARVRAILKDDPDLYTLLNTPLMISVCTLAFSGQSAVNMRRTMTVEQRCSAIFQPLLNASSNLPQKAEE